ncbi:tRNA pseudouridine(38-40) synthase TruA [Erysipelothrix sp. HDW6C]|uniref:tRNA pseudouridine(38-40) synthase TruA n=1 Tax=Erysipelothrix sp. HDW6C TaxID=2714930 RepID=UPI0014084E69|nr:tRNA pseudouridine(38-40) synthase TruA [Erysipelothrix sp. HDW6C]QIK69827.1 tRNA pseudouridine(38-40) synthase TruA [Erysipelothrix sp. HDW6C]
MRYKSTVSYDGYAFSGWQRQTNARSIQHEIERALSKIHKEPIQIHGSGRTDAGVHALGQVFHFDSELPLKESNWILALNSLLGDDIVILSVQPVADDFNARLSAVDKTYEYRMNIGTYNPFERNYVYQYNHELDFDRMRAAMQVFIGTHDFTSFNSTPLDVIPYQIKVLTSFTVTQDQNKVIFRLNGNGFLRYMVRILVATVIKAGEGKITPLEIEEMLEKRSKVAVKYNVPTCGLYLMNVNYK